jgi:hypothetical protein
MATALPSLRRSTVWWLPAETIPQIKVKSVADLIGFYVLLFWWQRNRWACVQIWHHSKLWDDFTNNMTIEYWK